MTNLSSESRCSMVMSERLVPGKSGVVTTFLSQAPMALMPLSVFHLLSADSSPRDFLMSCSLMILRHLQADLLSLSGAAISGKSMSSSTLWRKSPGKVPLGKLSGDRNGFLADASSSPSASAGSSLSSCSMPCPLRLLWVTEEKECLCQLRSMLPVNSCAEGAGKSAAPFCAAAPPFPCSGSASASALVSASSFSGKLPMVKSRSGSGDFLSSSGSRPAGSGFISSSASVEAMPALSRRTDQGDSVCFS